MTGAQAEVALTLVAIFHLNGLLSRFAAPKVIAALHFSRDQGMPRRPVVRRSDCTPNNVSSCFSVTQSASDRHLDRRTFCIPAASRDALFERGFAESTHGSYSLFARWLRPDALGRNGLYLACRLCDR